VSMPTLEDAIALAVEAHRGQRDKAGQAYILHPLRGMMRVETENERMAAILHDVVEDNMDVRRLLAVGPRETERLARYRAAWARLKEA
jgi:(p)ppGpp synthase/HD superfamily hydrolase